MVMDSVPEDERCTCEPKVDVGGTKYPPKAGMGSCHLQAQLDS